MLRILRVRLRAEWLPMLIALALMLLYPWFCGSSIRDGTNLYSYNQFEYYNMANLSSYNELTGVAKSAADPWRVAMSYGLTAEDLPEKPDLRDVYDAVIRAKGGYLYTQILMDGVLFGFPILDGLAMLLLCPLFRKRRMGQFLSAGRSRGQVWLSFTLLYFACAVVMWLLASLFQLTRFRIPFRWEQFAWLAYLLFIAVLPYLAALFLPRPIAAFFAALAAWGLLLLVLWNLRAFPTLLAIALALLAAILIAAMVFSRLHFRKRGFPA